MHACLCTAYTYVYIKMNEKGLERERESVCAVNGRATIREAEKPLVLRDADSKVYIHARLDNYQNSYLDFYVFF